MSSTHRHRGGSSRLSPTRGSAIITCMFFIAIAALMLGSVLTWANNHGRLEARKNELFKAQYVAEAATEKAYAAIRDYVNTTGQAPGQTNLDGFATSQIPNSTDNAAFSGYQIKDTNGTANRMTIQLVSTSATSAIKTGTYAGLNALITPYRVIARAYSTNRPVVLTTGIKRDIEIQQIPIFQFAIFYGVDMEIENGPAMVINGKVHSNKAGYFAPNISLTFNDTVTLGLSGTMGVMAGDTHKSAPFGSTTFSSPFTEEVPPLVLPIGAADPHDVIELPPSSGTDPIASQRMYNKAGLRVEVTNSGITVKDVSGTTVSAPTGGGWVGSGSIGTNKTMFNFRENKTITLTEIDISVLTAKSKLPSNGIVYVSDTRTGSSIQETAVRVVNADTLPTAGLTVATQNPIYLKGDYNTVNSSPAAVFADAINIVSGNWNDANASSGIGSRIANSTTVNAAFFSGNVPTTAGEYSGGVENFPRFLEDWSSATLTYKGSMVVMFDSEIATGKWSASSYSPPTRVWSFDTQFLDSTKLPPGTPSVRTIRRTTWTPTI
ncbi:MAG: hypothetical protein EXS18_01370 [Verrucomicrobiae bacterium]|nr:hypothetical protein [Verrucomicrobiae bacterium]